MARFVLCFTLCFFFFFDWERPPSKPRPPWYPYARFLFEKKKKIFKRIFIIKFSLGTFCSLFYFVDKLIFGNYTKIREGFRSFIGIVFGQYCCKPYFTIFSQFINIWQCCEFVCKNNFINHLAESGLD